MPAVGNLSSWIRVGGKPLPEYRVEHSPDGQEVTCWIPSEAGKKFYVCYKDSARELTTGFKVYVDGQRCGRQVSYSSCAKPLSGEPSPLTLKGAMTSGDVRRPFLFSDCQLVDDDNMLDQIPSIGQIKVCIDEIQVHDYIPRRRDIVLSPLVVHERAKKGIVHGVELGQGVLKVKKVRKSTDLRRLAVFNFNYRPLEYLRAEGIVPLPEAMKRKAPKPPLEIIDLTLVRDDVEVAKTQAGRVKTEAKQRRFDGEIIDLTI